MNCITSFRDADAVVEIWSGDYLNNDISRREEDKNIKIIQIERGSAPNDYIVQFIRLGNKKGGLNYE